MKLYLLIFSLFISFFSYNQITSLKNDTKEVPCYDKAKNKRAQGIDLWECGKLAGVVDCNEEIEYDHESNLFLRKAKDNVNKMGDGKPFTGACESCFMSGLLERRINFVNGRENGIDTTYYEDGCIQAIRSHIQGAESGSWYYYYDSTQVLAWEMNYYLGEKDGKQVYFKANGDTTKLETYKNGVLHGPRKQYFKGSKLFKEVNYANGLLDGPFKVFNVQGVVIEESNYKANKKDGNQKYYYDDGVLLRTENWTSGVKTGEFKMFYYQGFVQTLETYNKKGQKEGKFEEYYPDQKLKRSSVYLKDVLIEDHQFDEHGNETYSFGTPTKSDMEDDTIQKNKKK
ncbi:MAG: hypothetical protein M9916_08075 [Crocinitomicaceae bacterium]|nr:hypothetical protein [Crocinitomicaceae bacterium]